MNFEYIVSELERGKEVFKSLFENTPEEVYKFKPVENKWCMLEVLCHLYDEEREDFRARAEYVLTHKDGFLPPTDVAGWVTSRKYIEQDYNSMLQKFLDEREKSLAWLRSLENPDWENYIVHPTHGNIPAKLFLITWPAHDYLHIRQIIKLKFDYLSKTENNNLDYAGEW